MFPGRSIIFFGTMEDEKQTFCLWNTCSDSGGAPPITLPWLSDPGTLTVEKFSIIHEGMVCIQNTLEILLYLGTVTWKLLPSSWYHNWASLRPINYSIRCSISKTIVRIISSMRMNPLPHFICCGINPLVNSLTWGRAGWLMRQSVCRFDTQQYL